jgi:hypothetical protein
MHRNLLKNANRNKSRTNILGGEESPVAGFGQTLVFALGSIYKSHVA